MTTENQTVLGARNDAALQKAEERLADARATVESGEEQIENLTGDFRTMAEKILKSARNKADAAEKQVRKLSRTPAERRADQIALRDSTRDAFQGAGFMFHDTGADVGTVVWKQGGVRVTLRPDSPGYAKVAYASGSIADWDGFAQVVSDIAG